MENLQIRLKQSMEAMNQVLEGMIELEELNQGVLKLPAERFLDGIPEEYAVLDSRRQKLQTDADLHATEISVLRDQLLALGWYADERIKELDRCLRKNMQSLQKLNHESEAIVRLRMKMITEELHQVELKRRFLTTTYQAMAA